LSQFKFVIFDYNYFINAKLLLCYSTTMIKCN